MVSPCAVCPAVPYSERKYWTRSSCTNTHSLAGFAPGTSPRLALAVSVVGCMCSISAASLTPRVIRFMTASSAAKSIEARRWLDVLLPVGIPVKQRSKWALLPLKGERCYVGGLHIPLLGMLRD